MLYTGTVQCKSRGNRTIVFAATNGRNWWYVQTGGELVNVTVEPICSGINLEDIDDIDCFTWPDGIHSEDDLREAIEF